MNEITLSVSHDTITHVFLCHVVDDVQVSCYRVLNSLYSLGTSKSIYVER